MIPLVIGPYFKYSMQHLVIGPYSMLPLVIGPYFMISLAIG